MNHRQGLRASTRLRWILLSTALVVSADAAFAAVQAGVAAAVRGGVDRSATAQVGAELKSGDPIFLGDTIRTDADGRLQILLLDETVFTVGPDSEMVIDEFVYDPGEGAGKVEARFVKGAFRFITGKVAQDTPENMEIELPTGSIGIRGTIASAQVGERESIVTLLGPGPLSDADERRGGLIVRGGGEPVELLTPGYSVRLGTAGVSEPFRLPPSELGPLALRAPGPPPGRAAPPRDGDPAPPPPASPPPFEPDQAAGTRTNAGVRVLRTAGTRVIGTANEETTTSTPFQTPPSLADDGELDPLQAELLSGLLEDFGNEGFMPPTSFGPTRIEEILQLADAINGVYLWKFEDAQLQPSGHGSFDLDVLLDFDSEFIGFQFGDFQSPSIVFFTSGVNTLFDTKPLALGLNGFADYAQNFVYNEPGASCPCAVNIVAKFENAPGEIANTGSFQVFITNGASNGSFSASNVPRTVTIVAPAP